MVSIGIYTLGGLENFKLSKTSHNNIIYIIKIKIHSSCEIEDFVETHLCNLCVILRSRALRVVCPMIIKYIGRRLPLQLQCSYQGQQDDFSQSVRGNYKTRF